MPFFFSHDVISAEWRGVSGEGNCALERLLETSPCAAAEPQLLRFCPPLLGSVARFQAHGRTELRTLARQAALK